MNKEECREMTSKSLVRVLNKIYENYMKVYDEYYSENPSRDSAFLKDLVDSLQGISVVLEVYTRDGGIHPNYAIEKLENSKSYITSAIKYYKNLLEINND